MVSLGQIWAHSDLALDVVVEPTGARSRPITIVHSSELPEVDEWLGGGELLLTIGALQDLGAPGAKDYVAKLVRAGVQALGIGLGSNLPLATIPESLRRHAQEAGLPLFGVPEPVPFVAVVDAFTRMREAETSRELTRVSQAGRRFATSLAAHGITGLIADLVQTLGAEARVVTPTGRGLSGADASSEVRWHLIAEATRATSVGRLIRTTSEGTIEAIPILDEVVRGWIITPAEVEAGSRFRSLLLSTAAALLGLDAMGGPPRREESRLFGSAMSAEEASREWATETNLTSQRRVEFSVFGQVKGDAAMRLMSDLLPGVVLARAGAMMGVAHSGQPLVTRVAEVSGLEKVFEKTLPPHRIHHVWTVWQSQPEVGNSELGALLSSVDENAAAEFVERVLGRFLDSDEAAALLPTLSAFVGTGGARDRTAEVLGVHRHTVRARIARIERLLDRDLSSAESIRAVAIAVELADL